jgi:hypothetical protein
VLDGLLHPNGAVEGAAGDGEHHHEAVTQVLNFRAAVYPDRPAQQSKVGFTQLVSYVRVETRRKLG